MKRISIELFGQLRWWEVQKTLGSFINKLNEFGYQVDTYGTFWKDNYSVKHLQEGNLNLIDNLQLIKEPIIRPGSLIQYYYCLRESVEFRKKFNKEYDFYIIARPDLKFEDKSGSEVLFNNFIETWSKVNKPTVFHLDRIQEDTKRMEDKILIANKEALDILADLYTTYVDADGNAFYKLEYHRSLGKYLIEKEVDILEMDRWFDYTLLRHDLQAELDFDDGQWIDGKFLRQEAKKIQNYKEYVWFVEKYQKDMH